MDLRRYQEDAVRQIVLYAVDHPHGRMLLVMAPRAGKTLTGAVAAKIMTLDQSVPGERDLRVLWVAPSVEPLDDAVEHLVVCGVPRDKIGVLYRDRPTNPAAPFQVGTEASIDRKNKPEADFVVWDEAHHDPAMRRRRIRALYPNAFHLGLTGTPERLTGAGLEEDYDVLVCPVQPSELIADNHLAVPTVYAPEADALPKLRRVRVRHGDYDPAVLESMMLDGDHVDRLVREWDRLAGGRRTLVYGVTVKHSEAIAAAFQGHGIHAFHLDGTTRPAERQEVLDGLQAGEIQVVSSVGLFSEAVSLPEVKCCVLARPTRSKRLHIQQGSRCMTPWGNVRPRILDLVGNCERLGFPFDDQEWSLQAKARRKGASRGPLVRRCPVDGCGVLAPIHAKTCAGCGATFAEVIPAPPPIALPPLKLREVQFSPEALAAKRARLEAFAAAKGYEATWVEKVMAAMMGATGGEEAREVAA